MALMYGRRAPKNGPALRFANYARPGAVPTFPPVDYLTDVDWSGSLNGNDRYGDCVACATVNIINLTSTVLDGLPVVATQPEVLTFYTTQNKSFPSEDNGMDIQTACETLVKDGITIGGKTYKALGFVKVDHTSLAELRAAVSLAGCLLLGVNVAAAQQQQFPNTWDYVASSPIEGGHAIVAGGHQDAVNDEMRSVCWASEFKTTDAFLNHQLEEAWLIIWPWHLGSREFLAGMDVAGFAADYKQITGRDFPAAVTPPAPSPPPAPAPDADKVLAQAFRAGTFLTNKHRADIAVVERAAKTWLAAKGL